MPRSTRTGATVSRACGRQRNEGGPITRRFRSAVSGERAKKQLRGSLRVRGSASGQAQKPIQSAFGWETGGRPERPKTPIQNEFGWGMGLDGNGWASRGAVTMAPYRPTRTSLRDHPPREYSDSSSLHPHDAGAAASRCLAGPGRYAALLVQIAAAWALSTADLATDRPPRPPPAVRTVWSRSDRPRPRVAVCTPDTAWGALSQSPPHRGGGAPTR